MDDRRYPIGRFHAVRDATTAQRRGWIEGIRETPAALRRVTQGLDAAQLDTPYREGGWTVRQVVHHVPDSHVNAYVRFRLALTEDGPTIRPYEEKAWAELPDARGGPVEPSLRLLEALHDRWAALLEALDAADFARELVHPEAGRMTLDILLQLYAWHGAHHAAHVGRLREERGWR